MCLGLVLGRFDLSLLHVVCVSLSLCVFLQLVACVLSCFDSLLSCVDRHCLFFLRCLYPVVFWLPAVLCWSALSVLPSLFVSCRVLTPCCLVLIGTVCSSFVVCILSCFDTLLSCVDRYCLFSFVVRILLCFDTLLSCVDRYCLFSFNSLPISCCVLHPVVLCRRCMFLFNLFTSCCVLTSLPVSCVDIMNTTTTTTTTIATTKTTTTITLTVHWPVHCPYLPPPPPITSCPPPSPSSTRPLSTSSCRASLSRDD